jgi:hypothetical protein
LQVLRSFFARSDTPLSKVTIYGCNFGTTEQASQLLAAFETNGTVNDMKIGAISNLECGVSLGRCVCRLLQHMPQLHELDFSLLRGWRCDRLDECSVNKTEFIHALQPGLRSNRTLKRMQLGPDINDVGIHAVADAFDGSNNNSLEAFGIS